MGAWIPMNKEEARVTLLEIKEMLDSLGIKFWLIKGTLLGAIRENEFLKKDNDIDLLLMRESLTKELLESLKVKNYSYRILKHQGLVYAVAPIKPRRALFAFVFNYYYQPKNLCVMPLGRPDDHEALLPAKLYRGEHFIDFLGCKFRVPYPPEEWLERVYGNWKIPNMHWMRGRKKISIDKYAKWIIKHPSVSWRI